ncbi:MAG: hypothetical protein WBG54_18855 [Acidobacteriaceae bacterium]
MSLIKKADVKSHLSAKSGTSVYPFGLKRSAAAPAANATEAKVETDISISPSHPISPEAVPNAQVGGSVGVPAAAEKFDKRSL